MPFADGITLELGTKEAHKWLAHCLASSLVTPCSSKCLRTTPSTPGSSFENCRGATHPGFKSLHLRHTGVSSGLERPTSEGQRTKLGTKPGSSFTQGRAVLAIELCGTLAVIWWPAFNAFTAFGKPAHLRVCAYPLANREFVMPIIGHGFDLLRLLATLWDIGVGLRSKSLRCICKLFVAGLRANPRGESE